MAQFNATSYFITSQILKYKTCKIRKPTRLCPDAEPANMPSRSQFQQIELLNTNGIHTRNITESLSQALVLVIDDEGSPALDAATITHLTLTRAEPLALVDLKNFLVKCW